MSERREMRFLIAEAIGKDKLVLRHSTDVFAPGPGGLSYDNLDCMNAEKAYDLADHLDKLAVELKKVTKKVPNTCGYIRAPGREEKIPLSLEDCRRLARQLRTEAQKALSWE